MLLLSLMLPSLHSPLLQAKPPALAASDGVHTFTYDSVQRRLPLILQAVLTNNPAYPQALSQSLLDLAAEIGRGDPIRPLRDAPDSWASELEPVLQESPAPPLSTLPSPDQFLFRFLLFLCALVDSNPSLSVARWLLFHLQRVCSDE